MNLAAPVFFEPTPADLYTFWFCDQSAEIADISTPSKRWYMGGEEVDNYLKAHQQRDVVASFGRFPHRNEALGRASTEAEIEFLKDGPRFGQ